MAGEPVIPERSEELCAIARFWRDESLFGFRAEKGVSRLNQVQWSCDIPAILCAACGSRSSATVFVEVAPWTFEARSVDIDFQQKDQVVVAHGLEAGQPVVVKGAVLLND